MNAKQNALRILRFDRPEWVMSGCPDQGMPWPEAHIQALRDAVAEFGQYPIREFDDTTDEKQQRTTS